MWFESHTLDFRLLEELPNQFVGVAVVEFGWPRLVDLYGLANDQQSQHHFQAKE